MADQPVIELKDITFGYPPDAVSRPVLNNINLSVPPLDFLGIIGPNGGGKTTLLKIILGLLIPQHGFVKLLGRNPAESRHRVGYVPQHAKIDSSIPATVLDVVLMGRLNQSSWGLRFNRKQIEPAMRALEQTHTADLARRPIGQLSGGQRQRVLIARALACEARLLILDEPTAGVDSQAERGLTELLHRLNQTLPVVMVSHDIGFISSHLKTVACLSTTLDIHPASQLSDQLIADMYHSHGHAVHHADQGPITTHDHAPGQSLGDAQ